MFWALFLVLVVHGEVWRGQDEISFMTISIPRNHPNEKQAFRNGLMFLEALRYAVKRVNEEDFLYGFKLKVEEVLATDPWDAVENYYLSRKICSLFLFGPSPLIIGPESSHLTDLVTLTSPYYVLPVISYGATYSGLDVAWKDLLTVRTVPSDIYRLEAARDIIKTLKWNYFAVMASANPTEAKQFMNGIENVCFESFILEGVDTDIRHVLLQWSKSNIKAIFFFTALQDTDHILDILTDLNLEKKFFLVFFYGKPIIDSDFTRNRREVLAGAISIEIAHDEDNDFRNYLLNKTLFDVEEGFSRSHGWRAQYVKHWQYVFQCNAFAKFNKNPQGMANNCTGLEKFEPGIGYYPEISVRHVIDAIYGYAYGLRKITESRCNINSKPSSNLTCPEMGVDKKLHYFNLLFPQLAANAYPDGMLKRSVPWDKYDKDLVEYDIYNFVDGKNNKVGRWSMRRSSVSHYPDDVHNARRQFFLNTSKIWWSENYDSISPDVTCSKKCSIGHITVYLNERQCCWKCKKCPKNHVPSGNYTCVACAPKEKVVNFKCEQIPLKSENLAARPFAIVLLGCSLLICVVWLVFYVIFLRNTKNPLFDSSGHRFWHVILIGVLLVALIPVPYLLPPLRVTCIFRVALPGMSFVVVYASLFLKCYGFYRIYRTVKPHREKRVRRTSHPEMNVSSETQAAILICLVVTEGLIMLAYFLQKHPNVVTRFGKGKAYYALHCANDNSPTLFLITQVFPLMLVLGSTVFAFRARHYRLGQHEAKHMCFTLCLNVVAWAIFLPLYYISFNGGYMQQYSVSMFAILLSAVLLLGLFGKKIFLVHHKEEKNGYEQRQHARSSISNAVDDEINPKEDLQRFLDHHCPRQRRVTPPGCEEVFAGDFD